MTTRFSDEINDAYTSDRGYNPLDVMFKISQIDSNMRFIDEDMRVLAEEQKTGYRTAAERLRGFTHLGEEYCKLDKDNSASDTYSSRLFQ
jgi:hypothetical protein